LVAPATALAANARDDLLLAAATATLYGARWRRHDKEFCESVEDTLFKRYK